MAFIFSDAEVKEEGFLEYINQLLMTGEVSGLFPKDELDAVINDIRPIYLAECPGATPWKNPFGTLRLCRGGAALAALARPTMQHP